LGAGSDLSVRRAIAVGGQLVRVVFSSEPKHRSAGSADDALCPGNYEVDITSGQGSDLRAVGVRPELLTWPAFGLQDSGEFALDVQTDRPMVVGMGYEVTVDAAVRSALGAPIGFPYSATFVGSVRPTRTRQVRRRVGLVDLKTDPFRGGITVDASGDWASHEGVEATKKRVWRIALTGRGKFVFLPNFGLTYDIKKPGTLSILTGLRTDLSQQLSQQPDIKTSETNVAMDARGILQLTIKGRTSSDEPFSDSVRATTQGAITL
jgi:hypothetical protein